METSQPLVLETRQLCGLLIWDQGREKLFVEKILVLEFKGPDIVARAPKVPCTDSHTPKKVAYVLWLAVKSYLYLPNLHRTSVTESLHSVPVRYLKKAFLTEKISQSPAETFLRGSRIFSVSPFRWCHHEGFLAFALSPTGHISEVRTSVGLTNTSFYHIYSSFGLKPEMADRRRVNGPVGATLPPVFAAEKAEDLRSVKRFRSRPANLIRKQCAYSRYPVRCRTNC